MRVVWRRRVWVVAHGVRVCMCAKRELAQVVWVTLMVVWVVEMRLRVCWLWRIVGCSRVLWVCGGARCKPSREPAVVVHGVGVVKSGSASGDSRRRSSGRRGQCGVMV